MKPILDGTPETGSHWYWREEGKPLIGVDFHHTISLRCGACPGEEYGGLCAGEPQKGVADALRELQKDFRIVIYSGYGCVASEEGDANQEIRDYLEKHGIPWDDIVQKPYPFAFMIDDRAVHHKGWKTTLAQIQSRILEEVKTS